MAEDTEFFEFDTPLSPARHWQPRAEFDQLLQWWRDHDTGVCALVGIGGAGKTAMTDRLLQSTSVTYRRAPDSRLDSELRPADPVFIFSFYRSPNADDFFRQTGRWLAERLPESTSVMVRRNADTSYHYVLELLREAPAVLFVIDGLERVQSDGTDGEQIGRLSDGRLRDFVLRVSEGHHPNATLLITSRFSLADPIEVDSWNYEEIGVDVLSASGCVALLRDRGVLGSSTTLNKIAQSCGRHALTVDLAGGYIATFGGGDPETPLDLPTVEEIDRTIALEPDPHRRLVLHQERRLARIARRYHDSLKENDPATLSVLERVCLFRRGVTEQLLRDIFVGDDKDEVSGRELARLSPADVSSRLDRLCVMRLLEASEISRNDVFYTVHPAVRTSFRTYFNPTMARLGHRAIRKKLMSELPKSVPRSAAKALVLQTNSRPSKRFIEAPEVLDLLEDIVVHAMASGDVSAAAKVYFYCIGGSRNLLHCRGMYEKGARLCRVLNSGSPPLKRDMSTDIELRNQAVLFCDWALFLSHLGRLGESIRANENYKVIATDCGLKGEASNAVSNRAHVEVDLGMITVGLSRIETLLNLPQGGLATDGQFLDQRRSSAHSLRAWIATIRGDIPSAFDHFEQALSSPFAVYAASASSFFR